MSVHTLQRTLRAESTQKIRAILRQAGRHRTPVIPRSSSVDHDGSWPRDREGILLDLSDMKTIHDIDTRNRAVRFEPGVRWDKLQNELRKHGLRASNPLLPHREKSALASVLDREPSLIPKYEYAEPILTMEIVLPGGGILRTGSASGPHSIEKTKADLVGTPGPSCMDFYRLFQGARGTLGVVTWIKMKAETLPALEKLFFIPCRSLEDAVGPMYAIGRRKIGNECFALNDHNLAAILAGDGGEELRHLKKELPAWTVVVSITAGPRQPEKRMEYQVEALQEIAEELGMDLKDDLAGTGSGLLEKLHGPWAGDPYWMHGVKGSPLDIYFVTHLNRAPGCVSSFQRLLEERGLKAGEVGGYVQPLEYGRACHVEMSVTLDSATGAEIESISREAVGAILKQGGFFSRLRGPWAPEVLRRSPTYVDALSKMKGILDPKNIMNPEALCF